MAQWVSGPDSKFPISERICQLHEMDSVNMARITEAEIAEIIEGYLKDADSCPSRPSKRDDVARRNGMMPPTITR